MVIGRRNLDDVGSDNIQTDKPAQRDEQLPGGDTAGLRRAGARGVGVLTPAELASATWLGTEGNPGNVAANLQSASRFLADQKQIPAAPTLQTFQDTIYTRGLPGVITQEAAQSLTGAVEPVCQRRCLADERLLRSRGLIGVDRFNSRRAQVAARRSCQPGLTQSGQTRRRR